MHFAVPGTVESRFWSKVNKTDSCWLWTGAKTPKGYGKLNCRSITTYSHRISWFLETGEWPKKHILHKCDNPSCVRPDHLFEGDDAKNHADMKQKDRHTRGSRNAMAKLTEVEVASIKWSVASGVRQDSLASEYGVSESLISRIVNNKAWIHV